MYLSQKVKIPSEKNGVSIKRLREFLTFTMRMTAFITRKRSTPFQKTQQSAKVFLAKRG